MKKLVTKLIDETTILYENDTLENIKLSRKLTSGLMGVNEVVSSTVAKTGEFYDNCVELNRGAIESFEPSSIEEEVFLKSMKDNLVALEDNMDSSRKLINTISEISKKKQKTITKINNDGIYLARDITNLYGQEVSFRCISDNGIVTKGEVELVPVVQIAEHFALSLGESGNGALSIMIGDSDENGSYPDTTTINIKDGICEINISVWDGGLGIAVTR